MEKVFETFASQYRYIDAPTEYGLPQGAKFVTSVKGQPTKDYPLSYIDLSQLRTWKGVQNARHSLIKDFEQFDCLRLTDDEWHEVMQLEDEHRRELPLPFVKEALDRGFFIETEADEIMIFRRTKLEPFEYGNREIIPMVDSMIKPENGGIMLSGIGFVSIIKNKLYSLVVYSFGKIDSALIQNFAVSMYGYFRAQWIFHVCPQRLIEIPAGENDPFEPTVEEQADTAKSPAKPRSFGDRPARVTIARRIYLNDAKKTKRLKKMERHCLCWHVRGHWRTTKAGKKVWIEGYFKGPDRSKADAKTKIYVY